MSSEKPLKELRERLNKLLADLAVFEQQDEFDINDEDYIRQLKEVVELFIQHCPERKDELLEILAGLETNWN